MARISTSNSSNSSSNSYENYYNANANVRASCYVVNASTAAVQGFHYSTTGAGGSGIPSPPLSPPLAATTTKHANSDSPSRKARRGGAAYHITEECERLFCETLRAVFLGEGNLARQDSLVTGMQKDLQHTSIIKNDYGTPFIDRMMDSPSPEMVDASDLGIEGIITDWVQIWDYVGGNKFMGFVAEKDGEKSMFVFFEQAVIGSDLKTALMGLLELCDIPHFSCSKLIACLDRATDTRATDALVKDLGWIGFQLTTLQEYTNEDEITSDRWLFMDMDV